MDIGRRKVTVYEKGDKAPRPVIYMPEGTGDELGKVYSLLDPEKITLVTFSGFNWDEELTPWPAPPLFKKAQPFGGKADDSLKEMLGILIPESEKNMQTVPSSRGIAGYSLGGLFALYAAAKCDLFSMFGCISGSLWYPGLDEYMKKADIKPIKSYFSLGDREPVTKNPVMASVGQRFQDISAMYRTAGAETVFEWNEGNHFMNVPERIVKCLSWLIK